MDGCILSLAQVDDWVALVMTGDRLVALIGNGLVSVVTECGLVLVVVEMLVGDSLVLYAGYTLTSEVLRLQKALIVSLVLS